MALNPQAQKQIWGTELTSNDSTAKEELGILRWEHNATYGLRAFRYMQAAADTTVANGTALAFTGDYKFVCSSDRTDTLQNHRVGVGIGVITASYYGWIQCFGYHAAVLTDGGGDIADGEEVMLAAGDGVIDRVTAGTAATYLRLGVAVEDDDATDVAVQLDCI